MSGKTMNDNNNNIFNLLLTSYFGDVDSDEKKRIACAKRAYLDVARRIPYKYAVSYIENNKNNKDVSVFIKDKENFKNTVNNYLINYEEKKVMQAIEKVCTIANKDFKGLFKKKIMKLILFVLD